MTWILPFFILCVCMGIMAQTYWIWSIHQARQRGLYPDKTKATMFHVRHLIIEGEKFWAIRVYADIFKINHREAKKAIDELERSIQEKYFKIE